MLSGAPTHPSNDIEAKQNSLFSAANESLMQNSTLNESVNHGQKTSLMGDSTGLGMQY